MWSGVLRNFKYTKTIYQFTGLTQVDIVNFVMISDEHYSCSEARSLFPCCEFHLFCSSFEGSKVFHLIFRCVSGARTLTAFSNIQDYTHRKV